MTHEALDDAGCSSTHLTRSAGSMNRSWTGRSGAASAADIESKKPLTLT